MPPVNGDFHDNGPTDIAELLAAAVRSDHTPAMAGEGGGETGYTMQGNLFAVGYIRGILDAQKQKLD